MGGGEGTQVSDSKTHSLSEGLEKTYCPVFFKKILLDLLLFFFFFLHARTRARICRGGAKVGLQL